MLQHALEGIHVIEVASYIPGPVCTRLLGGLGARVTKVERPGGDPMRLLEPRSPGGENPMFAAFNAEKDYVTLDLKQAKDVAALRDLAANADVLLDGFRPGVLDRLGAGANALRALNPRLIYCALSGYGTTDAQRDVAGHDLNFVALSGLVAMTTANGVPAMPGTQLADMVSGLLAATAILAALQARTHTGLGATLDIAMADAAGWLMSPWLAVENAGIAVAGGAGRALAGSQACYNLYPTADGRFIAVAALEPHFWERFCTVIGRPDLIAQQYDVAGQDQLRATVAELIAARTFEEWRSVLAGLDACVTPVLTVAEAAAWLSQRGRGGSVTLPVVEM